jgi:hypothetical protein
MLVVLLLEAIVDVLFLMGTPISGMENKSANFQQKLFVKTHQINRFSDAIFKQ